MEVVLKLLEFSFLFQGGLGAFFLGSGILVGTWILGSEIFSLVNIKLDFKIEQFI